MNARITDKYQQRTGKTVVPSRFLGAEVGFHPQADGMTLGRQGHTFGVMKIYPKLKMGCPGDKYEQEAERVAEQVLRMPDPHLQRQAELEDEEEEEVLQAKQLAAHISPLVQRQMDPEDEEEEEELIQPKPLAGRVKSLVQRQIEPQDEEEEEEYIQPKGTPGHSPRTHAYVQGQIQSLRGRGQPLTRSARDFFEPRFGRDFGRVRIHTGEMAAELSQSLRARAFTAGRDVFFNTGQYAPGSPAGRRLLAHELTHVAQQRAVKGDERNTLSSRNMRSKRDGCISFTGIKPGETPTIQEKSAAALIQRAKGDKVIYSGGQSGTLTVIKGRKKIFSTSAVSGRPHAKQYQKNLGPIPKGWYVLHPRRTRKPITKAQKGTWGARAIYSGYQRITDPGYYKCPVAGHKFCKTITRGGKSVNVTRIQFAWGHHRMKIEGSARVKKPGGGRVTRSGFYIHGGLGTVTTTSGCIKVFNDRVFTQMRKCKGRVPLQVK